MNYRYLVFSGAVYYPCGGAADFDRAFVNLEEAKAYCDGIMKVDDLEWANVFDMETLAAVYPDN